jgi:hypothetical protein
MNEHYITDNINYRFLSSKYNDERSYTEFPEYKERKALENLMESEGLFFDPRDESNVDDDYLGRIKLFRDIKQYGISEPVELVKVDDKYFIHKGMGRSASMKILGRKIPYVLTDKDPMPVYLVLEDLMEAQK